MTCPDPERLSLSACGALEPCDEAALQRHLADCAACRERLDADRALLAAVAQASPVLRTGRARELVREAVQALDRSQRKVVRITWAASLAASVLALLVGAWVAEQSSATAPPLEDDSPLNVSTGETDLDDLLASAQEDPDTAALSYLLADWEEER